ncbi:MAG: acyl-CoA thioesterase [Bacteroidetes bacterium]|nr:acyl-CoA thioesterase [Bacteroidota bacterium]
MEKTFKTIQESEVLLSELMLPSNSNFRGNVHGGYVLSLMDKIAFACASKHSKQYCVTASVDTVDFLNPIGIGELLTMKASINYVGKSSMVVGIRVESENIQTGEKKHCNSSYFTMVAKDDKGQSAIVPGLILITENEKRRFIKCAHRLEAKKSKTQEFSKADFNSEKYAEEFKKHNVQILA